MVSGVVVIVHVLLHDAMGVPFTQDDEVIQAFAPETAQESLADRVGLRCAVGSVKHLNSRPDRDTLK
jgi:hypothetical protein